MEDKPISKMLDVVIITGASKGIGASIADKLANACKTLIVSASSEKIHSRKIEGTAQVIPLQMDLSDFAGCQYHIRNTVSKLENINSLGIVLCGGQIGEPGGLFNNCKLSEWDNLYKCNVLGNLAVIKGCEDLIKSGIKTRIVFFSGGGAAFAYPDFSGYALSKVAVVRAVENISIELKSMSNDASIIALAPGAVDTDILKKVLDSGSQVRTRTDISEPTNFTFNFLTDVFPSKELNGKFLHVRDDVNQIINTTNSNLFSLRRV